MGLLSLLRLKKPTKTEIVIGAGVVAVGTAAAVAVWALHHEKENEEGSRADEIIEQSFSEPTLGENLLGFEFPVPFEPPSPDSMSDMILSRKPSRATKRLDVKKPSLQKERILVRGEVLPPDDMYDSNGEGP